MKKPKNSNNESPRTRTYSFRHDNLFEPRNGSLQLLTATISDELWKVITDAIAKLCAYEYVEHDREYQKLFNKLAGERVTKLKVQRWLLGALIWDLERRITITLRDRLEADAVTRDFAPELTSEVKPEKAGQRYKEPIERLVRELVSIANQNRPALLDEITRRQQIAHDAMSLITPFRLSAMLIGLLSNGFIAAMSQPAIPKFVELVEQGFLLSLKQVLLPTRLRGDTRFSDPWKGRLNEFKKLVDDWFCFVKYMRDFSKQYKRKPWTEWIKEDADYIKYTKGRDQRWVEEAIALISKRMQEQSEANKPYNRARRRKCTLALGVLGLTCDLVTRMLNPPIVKPNGDAYDTGTAIRYYRKAGGTFGSRSSSQQAKTY